MLHREPEDVCTDTYFDRMPLPSWPGKGSDTAYYGTDMQHVSITARLVKDSLISDGSRYTMIITKVGVQVILGSEVFCPMIAPSAPKGNDKAQ